jgi:hypothetical protein
MKSCPLSVVSWPLCSWRKLKAEDATRNLRTENNGQLTTDNGQYYLPSRS